MGIVDGGVLHGWYIYKAKIGKIERGGGGPVQVHPVDRSTQGVPQSTGRSIKQKVHWLMPMPHRPHRRASTPSHAYLDRLPCGGLTPAADEGQAQQQEP